jgi:hypothetical protein
MPRIIQRPVRRNCAPHLQSQRRGDHALVLAGAKRWACRCQGFVAGDSLSCHSPSPQLCQSEIPSRHNDRSERYSVTRPAALSTACSRVSSAQSAIGAHCGKSKPATLAARILAVMRNLLFKCPRTGLNVQHWIAEPAANEPQCTYVGVVCPACTRLHFINSGKTLGLLCPEGPTIPASAENESWATAGGKDCVLHRVLLVGSLRLDGRRRRGK